MTRFPGLRPQVLTLDEVERFITDGYLVVRGLIPEERVKAIVPMIWSALDAVAHDPGKRNPDGGHLLKESPHGGPVQGLVSPRYRTVIEDLCGAGRCQLWEDGLGYMPIRFPDPRRGALAWQPTDMHVDGMHFHHHVNSAEQGLVVVELFSDIDPQGGGTAIRVGSHKQVARILQRAEPAGLTCMEIGAKARQETGEGPVIELTGKAGDVLFMHPHTLHGSSLNLSERARLASNHCVGLQAPMQLARADAGEYSPVEYAIHDALRAAEPSEQVH